jgi:hypothetical protein
MADDIRSRARPIQRRVQVGVPVFQRAGAEEQRLYTEGEPVPKTTDADIESRVLNENKAYEDERYAKLKALTHMNREPQAVGPRDPGYGSKDIKEQEEIPEGAVLNKEAKQEAMDDIEQGGQPEESPEEAKAKFKMQVEESLKKGELDPDELRETIKRLGR